MDFQAPTIDILVLLPLLLVAGAGMVIMLLDLLWHDERVTRAAPVLAMIGLFGGLITSAFLWNSGRSAFTPVSYTHLDVYKRQHPALRKIRLNP